MCHLKDLTVLRYDMKFTMKKYNMTDLILHLHLLYNFPRESSGEDSKSYILYIFIYYLGCWMYYRFECFTQCK